MHQVTGPNTTHPLNRTNDQDNFFFFGTLCTSQMFQQNHDILVWYELYLFLVRCRNAFHERLQLVSSHSLPVQKSETTIFCRFSDPSPPTTLHVRACEGASLCCVLEAVGSGQDLSSLLHQP